VTSVDVVDFYRSAMQLGIEVWIDGGWCVDALLGLQTRPHKDLDIAIERKNVAALRELLNAQGYRDIKLEDARPWNFVLGDENGREIDVHVIRAGRSRQWNIRTTRERGDVSSRIFDRSGDHRGPSGLVYFSRMDD
jgi:hypothetical protein